MRGRNIYLHWPCGRAFSQRYPYKVYALAAPDAATGIPKMLRVDHEAWDPVMQEIRGMVGATVCSLKCKLNPC